MKAVTPVPWDDVAALYWTFLGSYLMREEDLRAAGLIFSVVDDDGLDYMVAAFNLTDGSLAMVGRGVGGPQEWWTVGVAPGQVSTAEDVMIALGVRDPHGPEAPYQ